MHSGFRYYLRVRYGECDAQQVVFNARYGDYVDLAVYEYLRVIGYEGLMLARGLDYQVRKQTLEWNAPARFDDVLEATVQCRHIGTTSFALLVEIRIAGQARVICAVETVYVTVELKSLTKHEIPPEFRAGLERGPEGTVDHAAWVGHASAAA